MFSSVYQNGEYGIEIFAPSGNEPFKMCKLNNESNIKKVYDRSIKGYMAALEKESSTTFLQIPRSSKSSLGITQPLLVFQIQLHPEKSFTLELILLDSDRQKRRFHLSTKFKEIDANNLHVCIPWVQPDREQWTNVAINLVDLIQSFSPPGSDVVYVGLESFSIQPVCRLRKIFTLPMKYLGDDDTGLLIPPKYDFTSGVEANSWVFSYATPHPAHAKPAANKDLDAAHKNSKHPSKTAEGAKEGDPMGIVGKKVPRQESNTPGVATTTAASKAASVTSDAKNDQRGTMHWAAEESALKRQKAATASTTATPPPRNPWADSPAPASVAVPVNQKDHLPTQSTHSALSQENAAKKESSKKTSDQSEFKIHSAKFTDEEEDEEEEKMKDEADQHREGAMDIEVEQKEATPAPPSVPTATSAVVPPGGIKFSSKLKQKLGVSAAVPVSTPMSSHLTNGTEFPVESAAEVATQDISTIPVVAAAQDNHEQEEVPRPQFHSLPPASPVLPTHAAARQHQNTNLARLSTEDEHNVALVSQDFSAIDDFVKNYTTQQGPLQGYASFARVDSEIATQLNSKRTSATPNEETHHKSGGIATSSSSKDDPFAQIKQHERTPSRTKKFADVALSPMPALLEVTPVVTVTTEHSSIQNEMPKYDQHVEHEPMSGIAEGNDSEEADNVDVDGDAGAEEIEENEEMQVDIGAPVSRPPTSHTQISRPSTANKTSTDIAALSRPSTGTGTNLAPLPTPPSTMFNTSRPPTAPEVSGSMSSPLRQSTPHGVKTTSRPTTSNTRMSSAAVEAALLSPFSDAIAYFEQSKKSRDFSSSLRGSAVLGSDAENRQNAEPNVPSLMHVDETQSYFDVYQQRSSGIAQQWTEDVEGLLDRLSHPSLASSSRPATATSATVASASTESASFTSMLTPSSLATPLPERKKRAIRSRVASLLRQVEQAEMEYIAEFGFEAFEQEVGFFEEKTRGKWA